MTNLRRFAVDIPGLDLCLNDDDRNLLLVKRCWNPSRLALR